MNAAVSPFKWTLRFVLLYVLFLVFFMIGAMAVAGAMPDARSSEPGLVPATAGLLILANPLMPVASVRLSHMIETASSTFLFGTLVVWLLHRAHLSFGDLMGIQ